MLLIYCSQPNNDKCRDNRGDTLISGPLIDPFLSSVRFVPCFLRISAVEHLDWSQSVFGNSQAFQSIANQFTDRIGTDPSITIIR